MFDKRLLKEMPNAKSYMETGILSMDSFIDEYCVDVIDMCFVYTVV